MYCAQCILVMQINAESPPPRFAPFPAQVPRSWLPICCSQAPDSMSSLQCSASDFFLIKAFVDGLRNWYRSAAFDTKRFTIMSHETECPECTGLPNYLRPHGLSPSRLLCPWNSPGKNNVVGSHSLIQEILPQEQTSISHIESRVFTF